MKLNQQKNPTNLKNSEDEKSRNSNRHYSSKLHQQNIRGRRIRILCSGIEHTIEETDTSNKMLIQSTPNTKHPGSLEHY